MADQNAVVKNETSEPGSSRSVPRTATDSSDSCQPAAPPLRLMWSSQLVDRPSLLNRPLKAYSAKLRLSSSPYMSLRLPCGHPLPENVKEEMTGAAGGSAGAAATSDAPPASRRAARMVEGEGIVRLGLWWMSCEAGLGLELSLRGRCPSEGGVPVDDAVMVGLVDALWS